VNKIAKELIEFADTINISKLKYFDSFVDFKSLSNLCERRKSTNVLNLLICENVV